MTYNELIERMDPTVYQSLKRAIELGKWPDGRKVSEEQRSICMEAVLYYENLHQFPEAQRVGYIEPKKSGRNSQGPDDSEPSPIRILN